MGIERFLNKTLTQKRKASGTSHAVEAWVDVSTTLKGCIYPINPSDSIAFQSANLRLNITHKMNCLISEDIKTDDKIVYGATITGTDIAFVVGGAGEDTITQVAAKFLEIGFKTGDIITVTGSTLNDGDYTILSIVAGIINIATGSLTAETAGVSVTITSADEYLIKKANSWDKFYEIFLSEIR